MTTNVQEAQSKISSTITVLQEQRNSALDALVTTTVDLQTTVSRLEQNQKHVSEMTDRLNSLKQMQDNLTQKLQERDEKIKTLEQVNAELQESLASLKTKVVPKLSRNKKTTTEE